MPDSTSTDKPGRRPAKRSYSPPILARTKGPEPGTPLEDVYLAVGVIVGTHGLQGELRVKLTTDDPDRLAEIRHVLVGDRHSPYTIESVRFNRGMALIRFEEIDDIAAAEGLRGMTLRIAGTDVPPLAENEYYLYQVVGIEARTEANDLIGTVTDVIETGANMVFVVTPPDNGKEELFPSIPEVVLDIRPADGYMVVRRQTYWDEQ